MDMSNDMEAASCRVCFEDSSSNLPNAGSLFRPCKCTGSIAWIHEGCLKQWRLSSANPLDRVRCPQCQVTYRTRPKKLRWRDLALRALVWVLAFCLVGKFNLAFADWLPYVVKCSTADRSSSSSDSNSRSRSSSSIQGEDLVKFGNEDVIHKSTTGGGGEDGGGGVFKSWRGPILRQLLPQDLIESIHDLEWHAISILPTEMEGYIAGTTSLLSTQDSNGNARVIAETAPLYSFDPVDWLRALVQHRCRYSGRIRSFRELASLLFLAPSTTDDAAAGDVAGDVAAVAAAAAAAADDDGAAPVVPAEEEKRRLDHLQGSTSSTFDTPNNNDKNEADGGGGGDGGDGDGTTAVLEICGRGVWTTKAALVYGTAKASGHSVLIWLYSIIAHTPHANDPRFIQHAGRMSLLAINLVQGLLLYPGNLLVKHQPRLLLRVAIAFKIHPRFLLEALDCIVMPLLVIGALACLHTHCNFLLAMPDASLLALLYWLFIIACGTAIEISTARGLVVKGIIAACQAMTGLCAAVAGGGGGSYDDGGGDGGGGVCVLGAAVGSLLGGIEDQEVIPIDEWRVSKSRKKQKRRREAKRRNAIPTNEE